MADYVTSKGRKFDDLYNGHTPLVLFNSERYIECAHACVFLLYRIGDNRRVMQAIEDDGYLHELLHLACGIATCTHDDESSIQAELIELWKAYKESSYD